VLSAIARAAQARGQLGIPDELPIGRWPWRTVITHLAFARPVWRVGTEASDPEMLVSDWPRALIGNYGDVF